MLRLDPDHTGAHKGLAFLCFRAGDHARSLRYLERAVELAPGDTALRGALDRVREATGARIVPGFTEPAPDPPARSSRSRGRRSWWIARGGCSPAV